MYDVSNFKTCAVCLVYIYLFNFNKNLIKIS